MGSGGWRVLGGGGEGGAGGVIAQCRTGPRNQCLVTRLAGETCFLGNNSS